MDAKHDSVAAAAAAQPPHKLQTAGLVIFTSVLLLVEGISRTSLYVATPSGKWGGDHDNFPPVVLLVAALGLTLYALLALLIGFAELTFNWGNQVLTVRHLHIPLLSPRSHAAPRQDRRYGEGWQLCKNVGAALSD